MRIAAAPGRSENEKMRRRGMVTAGMAKVFMAVGAVRDRLEKRKSRLKDQLLL